jgi:sugar-phosphatase
VRLLIGPPDRMAGTVPGNAAAVEGTAWNVAAMLFDLDGTLVDSSRCVERTWRTWSARHGLDADHVLAVSPGLRSEDTIRLVAPHLDVEAEAFSLRGAEERCTYGLAPVPGALDLVSALPMGQWAVVTSAWRRLAGIRLVATSLPVPSVLISADDVERGKPDPQGYRAAAAALGVAPQDCVVVEDAPSGAAAGRAAGMRVIGLRTTVRSGLAADRTVPDLTWLRVATVPGP